VLILTACIHRGVYDIVRMRDTRSGLVVVQSPGPVAVRGHVVTQVVVHEQPTLISAPYVHAAHIRQLLLPGTHSSQSTLACTFSHPL
jgi:GTPase